MDDSFIYGHCTNCAATFTKASPIFSKFTVADEEKYLKIREIAVLDAVLYIYGFSATNLASAYLDNGKESNLTLTRDCIVEHGLSLCTTCVVLFKELYIASHQLKKVSNQEALLPKAIKKFSPTSIKIEFEHEENKKIFGNDEGDYRNSTKHNSELHYSLKSSPHAKLADTKAVENSLEDLCQAFNFDPDYEDYEDGCEDIKTDPLAEIDNALVSNSNFLSNNTVKNANDRERSAKFPTTQCSIRLRRLATQNSTTAGCSVKLEIQNRDYPKKSSPTFSGDVKIPSRSRNYLTRRTGSMIKSNDKIGQASNPLDTENIKIEHEEEQARRKGVLTDEPKEKAKLTLKATMKKYKRKKGKERKKSRHDKGRNKKDADKLLSLSTLLSKEQEKGKKILSCRCGKGFRSLVGLKSHEKIHVSEAPVIIICDSCGESFNSSYSLYVHKSWEHFELPQILSTCNLCATRFKSKRSLKEHQKMEHGINTEKIEEEKILKCSCGRSFNTLLALSKHERGSCHTQETAICNVCGLTFKKRYLLYGHKSIEHSELPEITFKCNCCGKRYIHKSRLQIHQEHHHSKNQRSFICDKCGAGFNSLIYLRKHINQIHKDEGLDKELFRCKECGILLKHNYGLQKHIREIHRSQKTFVCEQCGKTTKNMTNMRIHMKVHGINRDVKRNPLACAREGSDVPELNSG